ncbi:UNVERIFIED_CONTAM: Small EDRK-rich factor 2, partial [Eudyptes robustus]
MTRGNQRELARLKNLKKQQDQGKSKSAADRAAGVSTDTRLSRDADIMRQKQQKALEKKQAEEAAK